MANLVDRIVGWFDPHAGLARHFARRRLQRAYEAAAPGDKWRPRRAGASASADHQADAAMLRAKARSLVQNVPYVRAGLDALVSATVGTGIVPRATGKDAANINKVLAAWMKVCDADGRLDYYGIQAAAYRAMEQDGEVLLRLRPRREADGLPVPLQLQLLEIDWLDSSRNRREDNSNVTVNGIEYDALGRVAAYYLWDSHPGEVGVQRSLRTQSGRVEAHFIIHLFRHDRPGAGRGITRLAPIIARVRDLSLYEDAELARKNLETRFGVLYSGDPELIGNPASNAGDGEPDINKGELGNLPSGGITRLPAGSTVTVVAPTKADGYVDNLKYQLHVVATGMGVPYEMVTGDMREVNFSSARVRRLDFRAAVEQMQWLTLVPRLLDPIHRAFVDAGILGGQIRSRDYAVDYSPPKWDYVNPQQDVNADLTEVSVGLSSISEKLRRRGYDPDQVFTEIRDDFQKLRDLGVLDVLLQMQGKRAAGDGTADDSASSSPPAGKQGT